MKNIQSILNIAFSIVLLFLLFMLLKDDESVTDKATTDQNLSNADSLSTEMGLQVRYINTDSIWANYAYVEEIREKLENKQQEFKKRLDSKVKNFEKELISFQENAAGMSRFEGEQKQKELLQKEQDLQLLQEELSLKLVEEEEKMKTELRSRILDYLQQYKKNGIDLIFDYSQSGSLLLANDSMDITSEVLAGLNKEILIQKEVE